MNFSAEVKHRNGSTPIIHKPNNDFMGGISFGFWRIELSKPLDLLLSVEAQISHILSQSYLAQFNRALAAQHPNFAFNNGKQSGADFLNYLFADAQGFLSNFIRSGYCITNFRDNPENSNEKIKSFVSEAFGVIEKDFLREIWGVQREAATTNNSEQEEVVPKETFEKMKAAYEQAEHANRLKDELLSVISHELRTPLTSIVGWTQMLLGGNLEAQMIERGLETINRNAQLQSQLIEDLLDVSRMLNGKLKIETQPISLITIVNSALEAVASTAEAKKISINFEVDNQMAPVCADPQRMKRVFCNLLSNAIKFTPKNGEISLKVRNVGSFVETVVQDNGIGIKPDVLPTIFNRLEQESGKLTAKSGALGLGLVIVRRIVEMHGGTVEAASEGENRGATFTVKLPLLNLRSDFNAGTEKVIN